MAEPTQRSITLTQVLRADAAFAFGIGVLLFISVGPAYVAKFRGIEWYWELAALAFGAAAALLTAIALFRLLKRYVSWIGDTYERAKSRRDLAFSPGKLPLVETVLAGIFAAPPIFALVVPLGPFIRFAYARWDWFDSVLGDTILLMPLIVFAPLLGVSVRLSVYLAINLAQRITGDPPK